MLNSIDIAILLPYILWPSHFKIYHIYSRYLTVFYRVLPPPPSLSRAEAQKAVQAGYDWSRAKWVRLVVAYLAIKPSCLEAGGAGHHNGRAPRQHAAPSIRPPLSSAPETPSFCWCQGRYSCGCRSTLAPFLPLTRPQGSIVNARAGEGERDKG